MRDDQLEFTSEDNMEEQDLLIEAEVSETTVEIGEDWIGEDVFSLCESESDITEMVKDDPDPMFVILKVLTEGVGLGKPQKKWYTSKAIEETAPLVVGRLGFLGHQDPEKRNSEYRTPHMRILKSRVVTVQGEDGKSRKQCQAKAYVSKASTELRTHLREKMAGPVSIDGRVAMRYNTERKMMDVVSVKEIRCVDFCNPGTQGNESAGVESIVTETKTEEIPMDKHELLSKHGDLVEQIVAERTDAVKKSVESELTTKFDSDISEMKKANESAMAELKAENVKLSTQLGTIELEKHAKAELDGFKLTAQVQEMVLRRVSLSPAEGEDLDAGKKRISGEIQTSIKEIQEIAQLTGGSIKEGEEVTETATTTEQNESGKKETETQVTETAATTPPQTGGNPPRKETSTEENDRQKRLAAVLGR